MDPQFQPFMDAAYKGDLATFEALLSGQPALAAAASSAGHPSLFQFIAVDGGLGKIPNAVAFARVLIAAGAPMEAPFVAAASVNARDLVELMLDAGVSVEAGAPWTALEECLYWAHGELGAHLQGTHKARVSSLRAAAELGRLDLMRDFFTDDGGLAPEAGPVRYPFGNDESNEPGDILAQALLLALRNRQYEAAALLVDKGADVNAIPPGNHEHCTPLHQAVYKNDRDMIDWLMDRGAVATIEDPRFNDTAIEWARHFGYDSLAEHIEAKPSP